MIGERLFNSLKCNLLILFFLLPNLGQTQAKALNYYLPKIEYNKEIPSPQEYLGYQIGEWHISHDQLVAYCKVLAQSSNRIQYKEYGRSHENRPLLNLIFSSPENLSKLEQIRQNHLDNIRTGKKDDKEPLILYQGYSIHGNEASGSNAAMLVAYYLAAGQSKQVNKLLNDNVVIIDPSYNPDGLQRFSTWVNMHRSKNLNADENDREFSEAWPGGRTNHYWFDLNRDWLFAVHPESRGRIENYQTWMPHVLTDHHEMGKNSSFFFQPGVPSRTNPNTPALNQKLTEDIAQYHMKALDAIGSKYFMKKRFDDYYYGKGSTYPDANGAIGILFEQASTRGHLQERSKDTLSFPFAIRNQVATSLSTQSAVLGLKNQLIKYQQEYFVSAKKKAAKNPIKGYLFHDQDLHKLNNFISKLELHNIEYYPTPQDFKKNDIDFPKGNSYLVKLDQKNYTLAKTIFERVGTFGDSIFYDVSAWTLPLAYDLDYIDINETELKSLNLGTQPLKKNLNSVNESKSLRAQFAEKYQTRSDSTSKIKAPKIALLVGSGISSYYAGEIWHTLDHRFGIPVTKIDIRSFQNSKKLEKYNTLIMVNGRYGSLDSINVLEMKEWIAGGGKLICIGSSIRWVQKQGILDVDFKERKIKDPETGKDKFVSTEISRNANVIGGAIFENKMLLGHKLTEGYPDSQYFSLKKGTLFLDEPKSDKVTVILRHTDQARTSGYASPGNDVLINGSPSMVHQKMGKGNVIAFVDDPVFRGYWHGGFRLFLNAVFY